MHLGTFIQMVPKHAEFVFFQLNLMRQFLCINYIIIGIQPKFITLKKVKVVKEKIASVKNDLQVV